MDNVVIVPYKMYSEGAKALSAATGWPLVKPHWKNKGLTSRGIDLSKRIDAITWGNADFTDLPVVTPWNFAGKIFAVNKIEFFKHCNHKEWCPEASNHHVDALYWLDHGHKVLARSTVTSSEGDGITVLKTPADLTPAIVASTKVYVKYISKTAEYRIHVIDGKVVRVQKKVMKTGEQPGSAGWEVRSHTNGFVFQTQGFTCPQVCQDVAVEAMLHCGLDFGGVDVIYSSTTKKAHVLEINSAPGIEGGTVQIYANKLKEMIQQDRDSD